jgi:Tol biopolymer transport system component
VVHTATGRLVVGAARWSNDRSIVFAANRGGFGLVCELSGGAAAPDTLVRLFARVGSVAPSPDGRRVAFVATDSGSPDILLFDRDAGETSVLFRSSARDIDPAWDGADALVFTSEIGRHYTAHRIELGGNSALERIVPGDRARRVTVSPDRSRLAWTEEGTLCVERRDGTGRVVARLHRVDSAPSWSPDGLYVAVSSRQSGSDDVYIIDTESGRAVRVTTDASQDESSPSWHAVDNRIVYTVDGRRIEVIDDLRVWLRRLQGDLSPRTFGRGHGGFNSFSPSTRRSGRG